MDLKFIAFDSNKNALGQLDDFEELEFIPAYNAVRGWYVDVNASGLQAEMMLQAAYLSAMVGSQVIWSGTVRKANFKRSTNILRFSGQDELWMYGRLALPVPAGPPYSSAAYDVRSGIAETVIKAFIDYNAGPSAVAARRIPGLTIETDYARGDSVAFSARFDKLAEFVCSIGMAAGVGVRVVGRQAQVWKPTDRSLLVRYSDELDTLGEYEIETGAPDANYLYGGGSGTGTAQTIYEQGDSKSIVSYGRIERFVSIGRTTSAAEISAQLMAELGKRAASALFEFEVEETPGRAWWTDVWVGDLVTVQARGLTYTARLAEIGITIKNDIQQFKPVFVNSDAVIYNKRPGDSLRWMEQRVASLETK